VQARRQSAPLPTLRTMACSARGANDHPVNFVGAVGEAEMAHVGVHLGERSHCEMPVAPCIWIAWSMILQARSAPWPCHADPDACLLVAEHVPRLGGFWSTINRIARSRSAPAR